VKIDLVASEPHYAAHMLPIWSALEERGDIWASGRAIDFLERVGHAPQTSRRPSNGPAMVAGSLDLWKLGGTGHVFVEHGAGQTYSNGSHGYAGGRDRESVALFICPNEHVAELNRTAYPRAHSVAVGCPKMDPWHRGERGVHVPGTTVAISFHWNCTTQPEARTAFAHYRDALSRLAKAYPNVIGHGHPRIFNRLATVYESAGIESVADFDEVLDRADVYVCDNSSTIYEFASVGKPVVVLNAPWYRREIEHGLRFWEFADVGIQVDHPRQLIAAIDGALADAPTTALRRADIVREVYAMTDGQASLRAAASIDALERS
jgi:hypothetical protein